MTPIPQEYTLYVTVKDCVTQAPIGGAVVAMLDSFKIEYTIVTDATGEGYYPLNPGPYTLGVQATGYIDHEASIALTETMFITIEMVPDVFFVIPEVPYGTITAATLILLGFVVYSKIYRKL